MLSQGQIAYKAFLKSEFWRNLAAEKKRLVGKCEKCGSTKHLQAHHVTYPKDWYETTLDHLQVLCRRHHKAEHGITQPSRITPFREDERFNRFAHWVPRLWVRISRRGIPLRSRERNYLQAALKAFPPTEGDSAIHWQVTRTIAQNSMLLLS